MNIASDVEGSVYAGKKVSAYPPARWVLTAVREAYGEPDAFLADTADKAERYWREQIETDPTAGRCLAGRVPDGQGGYDSADGPAFAW